MEHVGGAYLTNSTMGSQKKLRSLRTEVRITENTMPYQPQTIPPTDRTIKSIWQLCYRCVPVVCIMRATTNPSAVCMTIQPEGSLFPFGPLCRVHVILLTVGESY